jgi:hypothetical protein
MDIMGSDRERSVVGGTHARGAALAAARGRENMLEAAGVEGFEGYVSTYNTVV